VVNLALFFKESTEEDKMYHYFMQKNAMAHTANFLIDTLEALASYNSTFESVQLLFVGCTETYNLYEKCTLIARKVESIQKRTCQYMKMSSAVFHEIGIFRRYKACL
jgi:hypothetical protein